MYLENPSALNPYIQIAVAIIAGGVSFFAVPRLRDYAIGRGWFDMPSARRIHTKPLPRIGGLGIYAGFTTAVLAALLFGLCIKDFWRPADIWRISLLLAGSTIITGVMLVDDLRGLKPLTKLLWQFGVAAVVILPQAYIQIFVLPQHPLDDRQFIGVLILSIAEFQLGWLAIPFTFLWIAGMMNTVNLTDGLDGLAGGVVCIGALLLWIETLFQERGNFQFTSSMLALALVCSILGFLRFNWHPSSIIMGDCGSMFLGYALAVTSIIDGAKVAIALLIIGFPILDVAFVYTNRVRHGKAPWKADRTHFHHRLLALGWTQRKIVLLFYAISLFAGIIGVLPLMQNRWLKLISLIGLVLALIPLFIYSIKNRPAAAGESESEQPTPPLQTPQK